MLSTLRDRPSGHLVMLETRTPYGVAVSAAGTIYVADGRWPRLAAFLPNGKLLWQRNVRGLGPGELMFPYRVVLDKAENVVVLDLGSKTLLWYAADGTFLRRGMLGLAFATVSDIAILDGDRVVVSGISDDPRATGKSVHVFSRELAWQGSFIALPGGVPADIQRLWGTGSLVRASWSSVLYAPKHAGGLTELSSDGRVLRRIPVDDSDLTVPTDYFTITARGTAGSHVRAADSLITSGRPVLLARGGVLSVKIIGSRVRLTEHNGSGTPTAILDLGAADVMPIAFDSTTCTLTIRNRKSGELGVAQLAVRLAHNARATTQAHGASDETVHADDGCTGARRGRSY
ncbi:MAG: hypothetical protein IPP90_05940 [Gemmatimonadaceae bacterium]|nr:hypothetical protein [Gemmatimonadaceae bacterium]